MITKTFMAVCQYTGVTLEVQTGVINGRRNDVGSSCFPGVTVSPGDVDQDVVVLVSTTVGVETGVGVATTGTVGDVGETGTACRE